MSNCDDPFSVLGVHREASPEEIRRAYRRLAMQWHPDRNPSDRAEAEFKRVHAAYQLFLDPQRLAEWLQTQAPPSATNDATPPEDLLQPLTLTLEEAAQGCRKTVDLVHSVRCASCVGGGKRRHDHLVPCPRCSGCGRVAHERGRTSRCDVCAGRGYLRETACEDCAGSGWRQEMRTLSVTVPPGLVEGERLRLAGQAPRPPGHEGAKAGDLFLEIRLERHPLFILRERDVHCEVPVSVFRLLCGGRVEVPTLSGSAALDLAPCPRPPLEYRLPGKGFPDQRGGAAGDLVVHLQGIFPLGVETEEAALLEWIDQRLAGDLERRAPPLAAWKEQMRQRRTPP